MDSFDFEVFARRDHLDLILIASRFAHEHLEELRAFVPPVSVELGIVRRSDMGRCAEDFFEVSALRLAVEEEVTGVLGGAVGSPTRYVRFFAVEREFSGDAMEFEACIPADAIGMEIRFDFGIRKVIAEISVKFTVIGVSRITDFSAPNLSGAFEVAREGCDTA